MTRVRAAAYKGQFGNAVDMAIMLRTLHWCSHIELGVKVSQQSTIDKLSKRGIQAQIGDWVYASSTMRKDMNGKSGPRWIEEGKLLHNKYKWKVFEYHSQLTEEQIVDAVESTIDGGGGYDLGGIFGFTVPGQPFNEFKNWYCSEHHIYCAFLKWIKQISPGGALNYIKFLVIRVLKEDEYVKSGQSESKVDIR